MRQHFILSGLLITACASDDHADTASSATTTPPAWSYEGTDGPSHWGDLDGYMECSAGREESPIALTSGREPEDLPDLVRDYQPSQVSLLNTGHTIQFNYDPGSMLLIGDVSYTLQQFHFHAQSEHTLDGEHFPMELHLVHQAENGDRAVLAALIVEGDENQTLRDADWDSLPKEEKATYVDRDAQINAADLLPSGPSYRYAGSLTTPPCTEDVAWSIFATPLTLSKEQIARFTDIYADNFRPLQPADGRVPQFGE